MAILFSFTLFHSHVFPPAECFCLFFSPYKSSYEVVPCMNMFQTAVFTPLNRGSKHAYGGPFLLVDVWTLCQQGMHLLPYFYPSPSKKRMKIKENIYVIYLLNMLSLHFSLVWEFASFCQHMVALVSSSCSLQLI